MNLLPADWKVVRLKEVALVSADSLPANSNPDYAFGYLEISNINYYRLIDRTPVHPREVFADALSDIASVIVVARNHPSGSLEPSATDAEVTAQLKSAGSVVGIALLDHIIFNRSG